MHKLLGQQEGHSGNNHQHVGGAQGDVTKPLDEKTQTEGEDKKGEGDDVLEAVDSIPMDFRLAVILADLQDFSYKEIADILDVPVGTVMSRLFRGRRLLQRQLAEYAAASGVLQGAEEGESIDLEAWRRRRGRGS